MRAWKLLTALIAASGTLLSILPARAGGGIWTSFTPPPAVRQLAGATTGWDGRVYVMGGDSLAGPVSTLEAYDPSRNRWTTLAPMPTARSYVGAATGGDGRIYAIGGYTGTDWSNSAEAYDPKTNTWARVAPMPTARGNLAVVADRWDGTIYAIGGCCEPFPGHAYNTVESYEPKTDTWTRLAPMPTRRQGLTAAASWDGRIFAFGGGDVTLLQELEAYEPSTDTWTTLAPIPTARSGLASATGWDGKIYAFSGGRPGVVEAYDPSRNSWSSIPPMPVDLFFAGLAAATDAWDGTIYVMGLVADPLWSSAAWLGYTPDFSARGAARPGLPRGWTV